MHTALKRICLLCVTLVFLFTALPVHADTRSIINSREELAAYLRSCALACAEDVSFFYGAELSGKLSDSDWLGVVMHENGMASASYHSNSSEGYLTFDSIRYMPEFYAQDKQPINWFSSMAQITDFVESMAKARSKDFVFYYDAGLGLFDNARAVSELLYASGIETYEWEFNRCRIHIYDVVYDEPFALCKTEGDVRSYMAQCAQNGVSAYALYCNQTLFLSLCANDFARLDALTTEMRITSCDLSFSQSGTCIALDDIVYAPDAPLCDCVEQVVCELSAAAEQLAPSLTLFCSREIYDALMRNEEEKLSELCIQAGAMSGCAFYADEQACSITFPDIAYRPGHKMLIAYRTNRLSLLTDRELDALIQAVTVLSSTDIPRDFLGAEKWIHDYLCETIEYTVDDSSEEDDSAIGALLNAQACCGGYADAFYLMGNILGMEVGYQTFTPEEADDSAGHAWNTILIDGQWYAVDVTWDDSEDDDCGYMWFNTGMDITGRTHRWDTEMSLYPLAETTLNSLRPRPILICRSLSELKSIMLTCKAVDCHEVDIYYGDGEDWKAQKDAVFEIMHEAGVTDISSQWTTEGNIVSFTDLDFD